MRLVLSEALHARPASLFVRVASQHVSKIEIRAGEKRADAKNILDVLKLKAVKGDAIDLSADGVDAASALEVLAALVRQGFDADLAPESGAAASPGFAFGRAVVLRETSAEANTTESLATLRERMRSAFAQVRRDLENLVRALPREEAVLFEPEVEIVRALEDPVLARVDGGEPPAAAIRAEATPPGTSAHDRTFSTSDLVLDACERILDAFRGNEQGPMARLLAEAEEAETGEIILFAEALTPSVVASLPERVIGIVAAGEEQSERRPGVGYSSHAAILARGRGVPLIFVPLHVVASAADGDEVVLDTRVAPPRLWVSPGEKLREWARLERRSHVKSMLDERMRGTADLSQLGGRTGGAFAVRVNVGSIYDPVPSAADGIGLVRTELLFAARTRPPTIDDQRASLLLVAGKAARGPIVVRLFDAGGDKPIPWLKPPPDMPDARGIGLLLSYPDVLSSQISAIAGARQSADVTALVPLVRGVEDIEAVRRLAPSGLPIGAMIETPAAVACALDISRAADFVCIGTNDLSALLHGEARAAARLRPVDAPMAGMISEIVEAAHRNGRSITVCGEIASDPEQAKILVGLGVDAISVASSRFALVKTALALVSAEECRCAACAARVENGG